MKFLRHALLREEIIRLQGLIDSGKCPRDPEIISLTIEHLTRNKASVALWSEPAGAAFATFGALLVSPAIAALFSTHDMDWQSWALLLVGILLLTLWNYRRAMWSGLVADYDGIVKALRACIDSKNIYRQDGTTGRYAPELGDDDLESLRYIRADIVDKRASWGAESRGPFIANMASRLDDFRNRPMTDRFRTLFAEVERELDILRAEPIPPTRVAANAPVQTSHEEESASPADPKREREA